MLDSDHCRLIYLLREPKATLGSMLRMTQHVQRFHWDDYTRASSYYIQRLHSIARLTSHSRFDQQAIFITHKQLIHSTRAVFGALEKFLRLPTPLREEYDVLPTTGRPYLGDPTDRIKAACILRDQPVAQDSPHVPCEIMHECEMTFRAVADVLTTHCLTVDKLHHHSKAA
jgi:hypothetical protein